MIVVNLNVESYDVYGGRAGHGHDGWLGNPFRARSEADRNKVCDLHEKWFLDRVERDPVYRQKCLALRGLRVGCFCVPKRCHLDTVARWVNSQERGLDMLPQELEQFGVGSIWRKRVAPAAFELRRIERIEDKKVYSSSHTGPEQIHEDYHFVDLYAPLTNDPKSLSIAGSGHRPEHIARGQRTLEEVREQIFTFYRGLFTWLKPGEVISGLARGFDLWFGWAAIATQVPLVGAIPYPDQASGWNVEDRSEWSDLGHSCDKSYTISQEYWSREGDNALYARNRWMVDRCTHLTSFWQGTRGGTAYTNDYAIKVGKPRLVINTLNGWTV